MTKKNILTLLICGIISYVLFDFLRWIQVDTPSYIGGARLLFGLEGGFYEKYSLTKPLGMVFPGFVELITGLHPKYTFLLQNSIGYVLSGILMYEILLHLFNNTKQAYLGMLAYVTCQPFAIFSLFIFTDILGWCFGLFGIYYSLKIIPQQSSKPWHVLALGAIMGLGIFSKESAIVGFMFACIYTLFYNNRIQSKLKTLLMLGVGFGLIVVPSYLVIHHFYNDSILNRMNVKWDEIGFIHYDFSNIKQLVRTLDVYWYLFVIGGFSIVKTIKQGLLSKELLSIIITGVLALALQPIYPYIIDRLIFLSAPFLIVVVSIGTMQLKQFAFPSIIIGGIINILMSYLIYKYDLNGILLWGNLIYITVLAVFYYLSNKQEPSL